MGNCDHQQFQFSVENIENFKDLEETIEKSVSGGRGGNYSPANRQLFVGFFHPSQ